MSTATRLYRMSVDREAGALERVLGVARRRGLDLDRMDVVTDGSTWSVQIHATAPASEAALALAQFDALIDVRHVAMEEI